VVVLGVGRSAPADADPAAAAPGKGTPAAAAKAPAATGKAPAAASKAGVPVGEATAFGPTYVIKDRIVNLADAGGRRYLRFSVALEFLDKAPAGAVSGNQLALYVPEEDAPEYQEMADTKADPEKDFLVRIKKYTPSLEDAVVTVLSSKTSVELASAEGKDAAKREIRDRCQRILAGDETITNVYFTDFVMQ